MSKSYSKNLFAIHGHFTSPLLLARPRSITHGETALDVSGLFDFVEHGGGEILIRDVAPSVGVHEELVSADARAPRSGTGIDLRGGAHVGPASVRQAQDIQRFAMPLRRRRVLFGN